MKFISTFHRAKTKSWKLLRKNIYFNYIEKQQNQEKKQFQQQIMINKKQILALHLIITLILNYESFFNYDDQITEKILFQTKLLFQLLFLIFIKKHFKIYNFGILFIQIFSICAIHQFKFLNDQYQKNIFSFHIEIVLSFFIGNSIVTNFIMAITAQQIFNQDFTHQDLDFSVFVYLAYFFSAIMIKEQQYEIKQQLNQFQWYSKNQVLNLLDHEQKAKHNAINTFIDINVQEIDKKNEFNHIIDYNNYKKQEFLIQKKYCYIDKIVKNVIELHSLNNNNNDELEINFEITLDSYKIYTDQKRLEQILYNLLSNSTKFCKKGNINIIVCKYENFLNFIIQDTGSGIPKDKLKNLGQAYKSIDKRNQYKPSRLGLSLHITSLIIQCLSPLKKLIYQSEENVGTQVSFLIDFQQQQENNSQNFQIDKFEKCCKTQFDNFKIKKTISENQSIKSYQTIRRFQKQKTSSRIQSDQDLKIQKKLELLQKLKRSKSFQQLQTENIKNNRQKLRQIKTQHRIEYKKYHILIVDDNIFNLFVLKYMINKIQLENSLIQISEHENAENALKYFKQQNLIKNQNNIDLIITDQNMDQMTGCDLCLKITNLITKGFQKCVLIGSSSDKSMSLDQRFKDCGAVFILNKPVSFDELQNTIELYSKKKIFNRIDKNNN